MISSTLRRKASFAGWALPKDTWTALPDSGAFERLEQAARLFWNIPESAAVLPASGASVLIARLPLLSTLGKVQIQTPTYNEHAAAFENAGWDVSETEGCVRIAVHPNNPDGRIWSVDTLNEGSPQLTVIDESFCDVMPDASHVQRVQDRKTIVLKSFGKFWGLAGLRLGFAIGDPELIEPLRNAIGPWQVSGPALSIGATALADYQWAQETRKRLSADSARLDALMENARARLLGGTTLFRLYQTADAADLQAHLAHRHIWTRIFPYSKSWIRVGLPAPEQWEQLEASL